jgi:uncharacterized 2Fe-2S/4Fe-4S cluster protein (DUF4445 family)
MAFALLHARTCLAGGGLFSYNLWIMRQVTVQPAGIVIHAEEGTSLREFLVREGLLVDFPCGGRGLCMQCKVTIDPPTESGKAGRRPLSQAEIEAGVRLACQAVIERDCSITIPEKKSGQVIWRDPAKAEGTRLLYGDPVVVRRHLRIEEPSLEDQQADWERLHEALGREQTAMPELTSDRAEGFSRILRDNTWEVDAFLEDSRLICIAPRSDEAVYGFAIDLGTTTVDVSLHNMETGRRIGRKTMLNRQSAFGADVISRTQAFHEDRKAVRGAALDTIAECAELLLKENEVPRERVVRSTVVGNSIMIHILHGLDPRQLTLAPYIPLVAGMVRRRPEEFGWSFQGHGNVETLPMISAFVGADTMGVILALDLEHEEGISLSIDIGTNGEIVLARGGELITTSTAAGPAFEGAQIACGMRALEGAVTGVSIGEDGQLAVQVIGDGQARGICGSGLISAVGELLEAGLVDSSGKFVDPEELDNGELKKRFFKLDNVLAFRLSSDDSQNVYVSQKDIRELQLAKGAIRTGIDMLLAETGVKVQSLRKIRLAGNFGSGVDIGKTIRIGLVPEVETERVDVVGNAALRGASLALVSREARQRAAAIYRSCRFLELAARPEFQNRFASSMFF